MSFFETKLFNEEMTAARKSAKATPEGSGSVMEAMKEFYHTVELEELPKKAISEVHRLSTTEGEELELICDLVYNVGQLGFFLNHNISAISNALYSHLPITEALKRTSLTRYEQSQYDSASDEDKEDVVEEVFNKFWDVYKGIVEQSYVVGKDKENYFVKFVPGSNHNRFLTYERVFDRTPGQFNQIERLLTSSYSPPQNAADVEVHAKATLDQLERFLKANGGHDLSKLTERTLIEVPLDYDFSIFFKDPNLDNGVFNITKPRIEPAVVSKYKENWSLIVSVRNKASTPLTTTAAKLAAVEVLVFPKLTLSADAVRYLTQAKSNADIKLCTFHSWVQYWVNDIYNLSDDQVDTVNSLLDNFHFSEKKEKLGIKCQNTRADDDTGLFVNFEGRYAYAPSTKDVDESAIVAYEDIYNKFVEECSKYDEPVSLNVDADIGHLVEKPVFASLLEVKDKLLAFHSVPLISNWDMNICASININPDEDRRGGKKRHNKLTEVKLAGGTKPTVVSMGEILTDYIGGGMQALLSNIENDPEDIRFTDYVSVRNLSIKTKLAAVYAFLKVNGKITQDIQDSLRKAAQDIHGRALQDGDFEYGIYQKFDAISGSFISQDCQNIGVSAAASQDDQVRLENILGSPSAFGINVGELKGSDVDFVKEYNTFKIFYDLWALLFSISNSSYLVQWERNNYTGDSDSFEIDQSKYWLDTAHHGRVKDIAKLASSYVMGHAFASMCSQMLNVLREPKNILFSYSDTIIKPVFANKPALPSFKEICEAVVPFLSSFGYIIVRAGDIIPKANEEKAKFKVQDANAELRPVPDKRDKYMLYKHQAQSLRLLQNEPRVAFLDISPGGGKTLIGLTDCLSLMAMGKVKRPLIIAPQNLIKNWIADLNSTVSEFKYNCIPITAKTVDKWGDKKLAQMILNSPPNTLFFTDMSFVSVWTRKLSLKFMNYETSIYTNLEWMKQFEFDYILIDECHYLKNAKGAEGGSARSRLIAELTLNPEVKYIRLASGTIISNDVDDIIGQARLVDPSIFRTQDDFNQMYMDPENGGWTPDAAERIRQRLSKYCGVARAKRKDWAYALPLPKEEHPNQWVVEMDTEFKTVYEHVCRQTIQDIEQDEELVKKLKKAKKKGGKGVDDDDILEQVLSEEEDGTSDDDDEANDLSGKLQVYIDRLEQFVNAPESDPLNGWNGLDFSKLNTPKMPKLVELLDKHFEDPDAGKVIIFVRHINSVYGIINRLPERYKQMAIDYHGSIKSNLNRFRFDDDIKIIVGVEMSMNTGENLQIASRIIRMELCWAPGEIEQAIARVFRPDFDNKYNRVFIYSDWIIVDDSLEIPKLGRLVSKTLRKVQFDEYASGNAEYRQLPYLKPLGMDLKKFLNPMKAIRRADQVQEYFDAYYQLTSIQYNEFITERMKYIDVDGKLLANPYVAVESCEPIEDAQVLAFTPLVPDQNFVNDMDSDGLEPFKEWIAEHKEYEQEPAKMVEKGTTILVYSEFGYGYIFSAPRKTKNGIQTVEVMMSYGEKIKVPVDSLYVASQRRASLKVEESKKYLGINHSKVEPKYAGIDPRESEGLIYRADDGSYKEYIRAMNKPKIKTQTKIGKVKPVKQQEQEEEDNTFVPENTGEDNKLFASLCVINDSIFVAFNAKDPDVAGLKSAQYTKVTPFMGIEIRTLDEYDKAIEYVSKQFNIVDKSGKFEALRKRFHSKTKLFKGQFANENIQFLLLDHKRVKNDSNIKLNYLVQGNELFLVFSIEANPEAASTLLGKKPVGVKDRFRKFSSMLVKEFHSKPAVLVSLKKVHNKVAEIVNYNEIVEQLDDLTKA